MPRARAGLLGRGAGIETFGVTGKLRQGQRGLAHDPRATSSKTGSPSMTAASTSNISHATQADSATSKSRARSGSAGKQYLGVPT